MKKYFLMLIIASLLIACGNGSQEIKDYVNEDSIANVERLNRKLAIQDSLKRIEGNKIFADFYFGMSENEYNAAFNKIKSECNGIIRIGDCEFKIEEFLYVDDKANFNTFYKGKLHQLILVHKINEKEYMPIGDMDHWENSKVKEERMSEVIEHFEKKYGLADDYIDAMSSASKKEHYTDDVKYVDWYFDYKNIKIGIYLDDMTRSGDYLYTDYYLVVRIQDPKVEKRFTHDQDSIKNYQDSLSRKMKEEKEERESKYTDEL